MTLEAARTESTRHIRQQPLKPIVTRKAVLMNRHWSLPMPSRQPIFALLLLALLTLHGCSKQPVTLSPTTTANAQVSAISEPQQNIAKACELVTEEEMSEILGAAVHAEPNDRSNGKTECIYTAIEGISPYVEFSVEWGSGEAAMMGVGMAAQAEPGLVDPYEGLGDQAAAVGPALMIRTGEDLVMLVFSGVHDIPSKAKRIFDTAKARM
jgi:hypothetical protein